MRPFDASQRTCRRARRSPLPGPRVAHPPRHARVPPTDGPPSHRVPASRVPRPAAGLALALALAATAPAGATIVPSGAVNSFDFDSFMPGPAVTVGDLTVDDGDPLTGEGPNVEIGVGVAATPTSGSLTVDGGSTLRAGGIRVANPQGSLGSTTITGAGTRLELIGRSINRMEIGSGGTGSMVVEQGAVVDAASDPGLCDPGCNNFVGTAAGSTGALTIRDPGSRVDAVNVFGVAAAGVFDILTDGFDFGVPGGATTATVVVENGGVLSTGSSEISLGPGGSVPTGTESTDGTVIVRGAGAHWTNAGALDMATGANSVARLQIENGGAVDTGGPSVLGKVGAATVQLASGATLATRGVDLGGDAGSSADMTMNGGSTWENAGRLGIGGAAGGSGKLVIDGAGTVLRSLDDLASPFSSPVRVGQGGVGGGAGDLTVSGGARLETFFLDVGRSDAAGNRMAITGAGTVVEVSPDNGDAFGPPFDQEAGFARVARNAGDRGELVIDSGALLRIRDTGGLGTPGDPADLRSGPGLQIARQPGSVGSVTVDNATVEITQVDPVIASLGGPFLQVGRSGDGTMRLLNGALVRLAGDQSIVQVSRGANGGPVLARSLLEVQGGSRLEIDAAGGSATLSIGQSANGDGEVRVSGPGSAITLGNGATTVNVGLAGQGILNVSGQGRVSAGSIHVNAGGSLGGDGTVAGQLALDGGQVGPGNSPGTLTVDGDFTMNAGTLDIEIGGPLPGEFDLLDVGGLASYIAGQILFDFVGGFVPALGDTFTFLTASAVSGFGAAATSATGLAPGLGFQVNVGAADLTLEIVAAATGVPEPASAALLALGLGGLWARGRRAGAARLAGPGVDPSNDLG